MSAACIVILYTVFIECTKKTSEFLLECRPGTSASQSKAMFTNNNKGLGRLLHGIILTGKQEDLSFVLKYTCGNSLQWCMPIITRDGNINFRMFPDSQSS